MTAVVSTPPAAGIDSASIFGDGYCVEGTGGVLVDGLDVIVDLRELDLDAVLFPGQRLVHNKRPMRQVQLLFEA